MSEKVSAALPAESIDQNDDLAAEIAGEQTHVNEVYAHFERAIARTSLIENEGLSRGFTHRAGDIREEETAGLFERDALVYSASKWRSDMQQEFEGLVFGRLDMDEHHEQEVRYIGRVGVRSEEYEPLAIDWRAPAAAPFYQATATQRHGVVRRRVLRCRDTKVLGIEDDLLVPEAPPGMLVVGDGALIAALTRSRSAHMHDIVSTIQAHQDAAIRAESRGITEITGGPGTGKTVVALHRAAYLLYSDRDRYERGGILVIGPSAAYTAYIERVLPSLGEESVSLRAFGDMVEGVTAVRHDSPDVASHKGSLRMVAVLQAAAVDLAPETSTVFRAIIAGQAVTIGTKQLAEIRHRVLSRHRHNEAFVAARNALLKAIWRQVLRSTTMEYEDFAAHSENHLEVEAFLNDWWKPIDPREVLLWMGDLGRLRTYVREAVGVPGSAQSFPSAAVYELAESFGSILRKGLSVSDAALVDELHHVLGTVPVAEDEEDFFEINQLDSRLQGGTAGRTGEHSLRGVPVGKKGGANLAAGRITPSDAREALMAEPITNPREYAHVLIDEAQDLSPMQWRMVGRRGQIASWTVVGDAAQAAWPDAAEAQVAREKVFGKMPRRHFHMDTNYRNAQEIFAYAERFIRSYLPEADIPQAVRVTGVEPAEEHCQMGDFPQVLQQQVQQLLPQVSGQVAVIAAPSVMQEARQVAAGFSRVLVIDPVSIKGLEYDAAIVVDPQGIIAESPGGVRAAYVALTRAAHRMSVVHLVDPEGD